MLGRGKIIQPGRKVDEGKSCGGCVNEGGLQTLGLWIAAGALGLDSTINVEGKSGGAGSLHAI